MTLSAKVDTLSTEVGGTAIVRVGFSGLMRPSAFQRQESKRIRQDESGTTKLPLYRELGTPPSVEVIGPQT